MSKSEVSDMFVKKIEVPEDELEVKYSVGTATNAQSEGGGEYHLESAKSCDSPLCWYGSAQAWSHITSVSL